MRFRSRFFRASFVLTLWAFVFFGGFPMRALFAQRAAPLAGDGFAQNRRRGPYKRRASRMERVAPNSARALGGSQRQDAAPAPEVLRTTISHLRVVVSAAPRAASCPALPFSPGRAPPVA